MALITAIVLAIAVAPVRGDDLSEAATHLVDLNVIAVDSHGLAVSDLTSDDFEVTDAGKPEKIAFFHHTDTSVWQLPLLGPNQYSNRGSPRIPYATIILFDLMNEGFGSRGFAWSQIVHGLENLESSDYLYLYILTVDGRLFIVHGLAKDGQRGHAADAVPWTRQIKPLMEDSMRKVTSIRPVDIDIATRVQLTFQALESLAVQMYRVPGRKNIVWVTDGVPIALGPQRSDTGDFVDFTEQLRTLSEMLDRAGVAIYPARQVIFGAGDSIGDTSGSGETGGEETGMSSIETLNELSSMTGGRTNTGKDVATVVKQAMNDVRTNYQMGYDAPPENWDNKFHKIRVICKRKGVRIQAKSGYYAWAQLPGMRSREAFESAKSTVFDAAEIGLRAGVSVDPKDGRVARFDLNIDAHDVFMAHDGNNYNAQLRLSVVHYLTNGKTDSEDTIPIDLHYNAQEHEQALKDGITIAQDLPASQNGKQFRIIVFDRGSNAIGSLTVPDYDNSKLLLPQLNGR